MGQTVETYRWSIGEFLRAWEAGAFDHRVELIEGQIVEMSATGTAVVAMVEPDTTITPTMLSPDIQASRRTIPAVSAPDAEVRLPLDQG